MNFKTHAIATVLLLLAALNCCPKNDEYCIFCIQDQCQHCVASYLFNGKCIVPNKKIENCATYSSDGVCKTCRYRYYPDNNGACQPITIQDCFEVTKTSQCTFCKFGILARNSVCSEANVCTIKNCDICGLDNGVEVCALCKPGYVLLVEGASKYTCILEIFSTKNCLVVYTQDPSKCAICDVEYFWNSSQCTKTDKYILDMGVNHLHAFAVLLVSIFLF